MKALAEKTDIEGPDLARTVARYNRYCKDGKDGDFNAFIILYRDGLCSFSSPQPRMPLDMEKAYAFICELV